MTKVAFYAPMKAPDHPNPSGDRLIANLFMQALRQAGFEVRLASRLRSRDGKGDPEWQRRMIALGERLAQRLIRQWDEQGYQPDAWFTYHVYYKAPDLIGPHIARHYRIPYLVAEASWAGKRATGAWQLYHQQLGGALQQASRIFSINPVDTPALQHYLANPATIISLPPFLDLQKVQPAKTLPFTIQPNVPKLITIAMFRPGDKLASYRLLAEALQYLNHEAFQWFIVGDGQARETVHELFKTEPRICFTGQLPSDQVYALLARCELHVWPAVNEAFGMTILEAQYQQVAILSGNEGGVSYIMSDGVTGKLVPKRDPQALAEALKHLLHHPQQLAEYQRQARSYVERKHSITTTAETLKQLITNSLTEFNHDRDYRHSPRHH